MDGRSKRRVDRAGKRYGALVALYDVGYRDRTRWWKCVCDCGTEIVVKSYDLGHSRGRRSCGCQSKTIGDITRIHGMSKHPAHNVWASMRNRCYRQKDSGWKNYGGRGIKVCARWRWSFANFWEDMGDTYKKGLTIERKNNSKGYNKENCFWATRFQQGQNKRNNRMLQTPWGKLCLIQASRISGIGVSTLRNRLRKRWSAKFLFSVPDSTRRVAQ